MNKENTVYCSRLKKLMPALDVAPIKGPIGYLIVKNVSSMAWEEWVETQMKIINEERLDLSEEKAQRRLFQHMISFLGLGEFTE